MNRQTQKNHPKVACLLALTDLNASYKTKSWWRRRGSKPRPQALRSSDLHVYSAFILAFIHLGKRTRMKVSRIAF